jgi:putative transposase
VVKAASRREAAVYLRQTYQVSERRAGRLLCLSNSSLRYRSRRPPAEELRRRLSELAAERPRYGYQRLWALLRREGWEVNHKRVYRLYVEEGLKLRKRRRRSRAHVERYSMDFMRDTLADGRVFRTLNIVDDYTRVPGHRSRHESARRAGGAGVGEALSRGASAADEEAPALTAGDSRR